MALAMSAKVGNPSRKLVLLKLCDNANDKGECWPSLQHIADQCEISRRTAINHIQSLADDGFLEVQNRFKNNEQISNFYIIDLERHNKKTDLGGENSALPPSEKFALGGETVALGSENIAPPPSEISAHRTSHSFEPVIEPVNKLNTSQSSAIDDVFNYWKTFMNHPRAKLDDKRRNKIRDALKLGYTKEDLIDAIHGCAKDPWCMGQDPRNSKVFDDIELIVRDAKHIDNFIKINLMPKSPTANQPKFDPLAYVNKNRDNPQASSVLNSELRERGVTHHAN